MSMKFLIILLLRVYVILDSKVDTASKCINALEYNSMCS